jgi:hypothetical protein
MVALSGVRLKQAVRLKPDTTSVAALAIALIGFGTTVHAQPASRFYAGGSLGTFSVSADEVDGRSAAGSFFGGVAISRFVDGEVELALPTDTFTRSYSGISESFAGPGASRAEIERLGVTTRFDKLRDVTSNLSGAVIFHPPTARFTPGLIIGVANQRVKEQTVYTPLNIPSGVDPHHPAVIAREEHSSRNLGALTIGANLAIALTPHVFVVPDVRYDYGSIGDEINNALRVSVRGMWRF